MNSNLLANHPPGYDRKKMYILDGADVGYLDRWLKRTVQSMGTPATALVYKEETVRSASVVRIVDSNPVKPRANRN